MIEITNLDTSWDALLRPWISDQYFNLSCAPPFQADASECSLINAWWLCELSRLIYRPGPDETGSSTCLPTRAQILDRVGLQEIGTFSSGTNYCALIASQEGTRRPFAALVFRGTSGFEGWLSNLKAVQSSWPAGGSVHSGFKADFFGLWQKMEPALWRIDFPLYVTGHSLGGALAILAASIFSVKAVYTFGAPKTGDSVFADSLKNERIYRFENDRDIITTVPPSAIPFDFCHVGVPFCLKDDFRESGCVRGLTDPPEFLFHHAPVNYTIRLETGLFQHRISGD